ncbi:carbohydrate ABC transporter substrate-binding protein, CUT1 family [Paenibacillus sp. RU5A]|nr:carbohydrate ABC transporter substrate-binding protein, CUT1 family [Paenibacillus sp. RU5A]SOC64834.1 carbohydrate ABC transporter substrate-binding protein, CUT1 family [Paenibacillus sp. RU26A]SOC68603.1 carbohydrate ABC transporter substrate-binding protein, CUT1 family [Paenibacillus sp. RU5M]
MLPKNVVHYRRMGVHDVRISALTKTKWVVILLLSACIPTDHTSGYSGQSMPVVDGQPSGDHSIFEKYSSPVEVSFVREAGDDLEPMISQLPGETLLDNRWTRLYEQELGIKLRYDWIAKGEMYGQKLGVSLAAGRIPDVVKVNPYQLRQLSNAGLIQDLSEVYTTYASPLAKSILEAEGSGPFDAATIDGKLMAIPETASSIETAQYLWIRTDWLERLELQPPETMEDVLEISKAFTQEDPDGNGQQDTYGLALTNHLWDPVMGVAGLMAGYGAYPNIWIKDAHGKLVYGGIQPEVREALQVLQTMYLEGQLDPEFSYKKGTQAVRLIKNGKIGMLYGEQWTPFMIQSSRENDAAADWQSYPIVAKSGNQIKVPLRTNTWQYFAVRKDYAHPEVVMKLMNLHLQTNWGEQAQYETYYNDDSKAVWMLSPVTPFPGTKNLDAYRQIREAQRSGNLAVLQDEASAIQKRIEAYATEGVESGWGWNQTYGPTGAFSIADGYERNGQLLYDQFTGGITETMVDRQMILNDLQLEAYMNIILGRPIEEFDQFVESWLKLGGEQITTEVNAWLKTKTALER